MGIIYSQAEVRSGAGLWILTALHNEVNSSSCANESNFKERLNLNFQVFRSLTIFIFILGFSWF